MKFFLPALLCTVAWGLADLFYKKSSDETDKTSHLKLAVWVGLVMGVCALLLLPFAETAMTPRTLLVNAVHYLPASVCYIVSMVIGYAGLRYLELSVASPVQNASGALASVCMIVWFALKGESITSHLSIIDIIGTLLIILGVIALAVVEQRLSTSPQTAENDRKYTYGALALLFPIAYCLFDTFGTAADGILLDEETGMGLGEIDVLILYGLTFFIAGIAAYILLWVKNRAPYRLLCKTERDKAFAALCEEGGQVFYVFAMASRPVLAAPMIASYCIVSVVLSRFLIGERPKRSQYACVFTVIAGIVLLGISEGLSS